MNEIIIVSDGKELAYAKSLADLFKTQVNDEFVFGRRGRDVNVEMYSKQTYLRSNISKKAIIVIVGSADIPMLDMKTYVDVGGIKMQVGNRYVRFAVDENKIDLSYDNLYKKLQEEEKKYFEQEIEYIQKVNREKSQYIATNKMLFKKETGRIAQAYLYLAYYFYLYELDNLFA